MFKWIEKRRVRNDLLSDMGYHKEMTRKFEKELLNAFSWKLQKRLEERINYHRRKVEEIKNTLRVLVK